MKNFYHPYQFIPVDTRRTQKQRWRDRNDIVRSDNAFTRHDRWRPESQSGRITCTLTCRTPLVAGAEQRAGNRSTPGEVQPYRLPDATLAIPGNSLRGMIASIAEAISQSALRVLTREEDLQWSVRKPVESPLKELGILRHDETGWHIRVLPMSEVISIPVNRLGGEQTHQHDENPAPRHIALNSDGRFQRFIDSPTPDSRTGILFRRGSHEDMPNKKKEKFIVWDGELETLERLSVDDAVVETFDRILHARQDALKEEGRSFPLLPIGYEGRDWKGRIVRSGDIVWFGRDKERVVELSYSAIWRKAVPGALHEAFSRTAGKDSLPWNPEREALTPAEALFGVVEENPESHRNARNLASRLRFHDALPLGDVKLEKELITLKILASPKPPSPAMYFAAASNGYIAKKDLDLSRHNPNGRKFYLPTTDTGNHWESRITDPEHNWKPHLRARPVAAKSRFRFTIAFENLSADELALLCAALRPGEGFIHRLGLGKPLGLGQVEIAIERLELIDRPNRYSPTGLTAPRYRQATPPTEPGNLVDRAALSLLRQIGVPSHYDPDLPVCYPYTTEQEPYAETEGYRWFVANDKKHGPRHILKKPVAGQPPRYLEPNEENADDNR